MDATEHLSLVWWVVKRLGLKGERAETAFSDGCVGLVLASKRYDASRGTVANYVQHAIRGSILRGLERRSREVMFSTLGASFVRGSNRVFATVPSAAETAGERDDASRVHRALDRLPARLRGVLRDRYCSGFSVLEIAKQMGRHRERVRQLEQQGLAKLKDELVPFT